MEITVEDDKRTLGAKVAFDGAAKLRQIITTNGEARIIVATGASQFEMLDALAREPDIAWEKVTVFHLDEYVGLPITHPASFRQYLWERFHRKLPMPPRAFHYLDGEKDGPEECARVGAIIRERPVDIAFIGIGENGHIAFNDPPADFATDSPYLVVELDEACRRQQLGEGWFPSFDAVPARALSMSVRQIMMSRSIICTVPDERKAEAVRNAVEGPVTPDVPASVLKEHSDCHLYLDAPAASLLTR